MREASLLAYIPPLTEHGLIIVWSVAAPYVRGEIVALSAHLAGVPSQVSNLQKNAADASGYLRNNKGGYCRLVRDFPMFALSRKLEIALIRRCRLLVDMEWASEEGTTSPDPGHSLSGSRVRLRCVAQL